MFRPLLIFAHANQLDPPQRFSFDVPQLNVHGGANAVRPYLRHLFRNQHCTYALVVLAEAEELEQQLEEAHEVSDVTYLKPEQAAPAVLRACLARARERQGGS